MQLVDALQLVIDRTGHERFSWLTSEDNPDPHSRAAYQRLVIQLASGNIAPPPESALVDPWLLAIRACPNWNAGCCASPAPFCSRFEIHPSRQDCIECLTIEGKHRA